MTFFTQKIIWPAGKLTSAQAYKAWADQKNQDAAVALGLSAQDNSLFTEIDTDIHGQPVTTYFGPSYTIDGVNVIEEPADGPAMRADGVLSSTWDPPED